MGKDCKTSKEAKEVQEILENNRAPVLPYFSGNNAPTVEPKVTTVESTVAPTEGDKCTTKWVSNYLGKGKTTHRRWFWS